MDADHALRVIRETREHVMKRFSTEDRNIMPRRASADVLLGSSVKDLLNGARHVLWMLDEMELWIADQTTMDAKKWEKVQRWLGFAQGALWAFGIYTIDEMRKQNTSEAPQEGAPSS